MRKGQTDNPQLYKPWELRDDEEDRIDGQISQAKAQIEQELAGSEATLTPRADGDENGMFRETQDVCMRSLYTASNNIPANEKTPQADDATNASATIVEPSHNADQTAEDSARAGNDQNEQPPQPKIATEAVEPLSSNENGHAASAVSIVEDTQENAATTQDDHDDHVVEGEEDTVIY